ncbi:MAG: hypothetical protein ACI3V0_08505 [Faecousia sp.]
MKNNEQLTMDEVQVRILQVVDLVDCMVDVLDAAAEDVEITPSINKVFSLATILSDYLGRAAGLMNEVMEQQAKTRTSTEYVSDLQAEVKNLKDALAEQEMVNDYLKEVCKSHGVDLGDQEQ